jgi:hypothetical protein
MTKPPAKKKPKERMIALFPGLIDLVFFKGVPHFLFLDEKTAAPDCSAQIERNGEILIPPGERDIPFPLVPMELFEKQLGTPLSEVYGEILTRLRKSSQLPTDLHYHLLDAFVFFTHLPESVEIYPFIHFFGPPERGKSRVVKTLRDLCFRSFMTETLNEAYLFRFAEHFRGTLLLDLYEISERAMKKGCTDLLLNRYERGARVARVTAPDRGPFRDTQYFDCWGPTILATNKAIPSKDPLLSRCLQIVMPEARGIYPRYDAKGIMEIRAALLGFRASNMARTLSAVVPPCPGRLGDLLHPLLSVSKLLPPDAEESILSLVSEILEEKQQSEAETLEGRICQALYDLHGEVREGMLQTEKLRSTLNEGVKEEFQISSIRLGMTLRAIGIKTKPFGIDRLSHIVWNQPMFQRLFERYGIEEPRETRETSKTGLSAEEPLQAGIGETRETRETFPDGETSTMRA